MTDILLLLFQTGSKQFTASVVCLELCLHMSLSVHLCATRSVVTKREYCKCFSHLTQLATDEKDGRRFSRGFNNKGNSV
jgi:hypothetical protein